jgi:hypothetical protein
MARFKGLPHAAAWRHVKGREGFEVVFLAGQGDAIRVAGQTAAVEDDEPWWVGYDIELDADWRTRRALVRGRSAAGKHETLLEADGAGGWRVDGASAPELSGCLDVDLESSALTNTFPVHRLRFEDGVATSAPAAYVRAGDVRTERIEQTYERLRDRRFHYVCERFEADLDLVYDARGLVTDYPGLAVRVF